MEVEGKVAKQYVSVLIDLGSHHSYVTPKIDENFSLKKNKHGKSWLVQLDPRTQRKVSDVVVE